MAATTRTGLSNIRITDLAACKSALDAASGPKAKFKIFDELIDQGLDSVVLDIRNYTDIFSPSPFETHFPYDGIEHTLARRALDTMQNSLSLSEHLMQSIGDSGSRQLDFICHSVDTYIHNKIFHVLNKIVSTRSYGSIFINSSHPLHMISDNMWNFQRFQHGECPCHGQTTFITVEHVVGEEMLTIDLTIKVKPRID